MADMPKWKEALTNALVKEGFKGQLVNSELGLRVDFSHALRGVMSLKFEGSVEDSFKVKGVGHLDKNYVRVYSITNRGRNHLDTMVIYDVDRIEDKERLRTHLKDKGLHTYKVLLDFYYHFHNGLINGGY